MISGGALRGEELARQVFRQVSLAMALRLCAAHEAGREREVQEGKAVRQPEDWAIAKQQSAERSCYVG